MSTQGVVLAVAQETTADKAHHALSAWWEALLNYSVGGYTVKEYLANLAVLGVIAFIMLPLYGSRR